MLRHVGEVDDDLDSPGPMPSFARKKGPLLYFDFVEICGGAGKVGDALVAKGRSVALSWTCPRAAIMTYGF